MLNPELNVPRTETFARTFSIRYDYPVHFTRDLCNPCFRQVLMPSPSARLQRLAVFIDEGVTLAWPQLAGRIADYTAAHAAPMELVGDIVVIPGGEAVKNQHDRVEALLKDLSARHVDRQSYALTIGGGAVLDAVGFVAAIFHRGVRSGVGVKNAINAFAIAREMLWVLEELS
jgi:3-dehydroquinate synthase